MTTTADTLQHLKSLLAMIDETVVKAKSNTSALYTQHLPDLSTAITTALLSNDQDVINNLTKVDKSIASGEVMAGGEDLAKVKSAIVALNGKVKVKDDKSVPLAAADIRAFFPNLDAFGIAKKNLLDLLQNTVKQGVDHQSKLDPGAEDKKTTTDHHKHAVFATLHVNEHGAVVVEATNATKKNNYYTIGSILRMERQYKLTAQLRQQLLGISLKRYGFISHIPSFVYNFLKDQQDKGVGAVVQQLRTSSNLSATVATKEEIVGKVNGAVNNACDEQVLLDLASLSPESFDSIFNNTRTGKSQQTPLGNTMEFVMKNAVFEQSQNARFADWSSIQKAKQQDVPHLKKVVETFENLTAFLNKDVADADKHVDAEKVWAKLFPPLKDMFGKLYVSFCKKNNVKMGPNDRAPCIYVQQTNKTARNIAMMAWIDEETHKKAHAVNTKHTISKLAKRVKGAAGEKSKLVHMKKAVTFVRSTLAEGKAPQHVKDELFAELKNRAIGYVSAKKKAGDNNACRFDDELNALKELVKSGVFSKACGKEISWDELIKPWANKRSPNK